MLEIPPSASVYFLFHEKDIDEGAKDKGREREREVRKAWQGQGMRKGRKALQSSGKQHYLAHALAVHCQVRLPAVAALTHRGVNNWNLGPVYSGSPFHIAALMALTTSPAPALPMGVPCLLSS